VLDKQRAAAMASQLQILAMRYMPKGGSKTRAQKEDDLILLMRDKMAMMDEEFYKTEKVMTIIRSAYPKKIKTAKNSQNDLAPLMQRWGPGWDIIDSWRDEIRPTFQERMMLTLAKIPEFMIRIDTMQAVADLPDLLKQIPALVLQVDNISSICKTLKTSKLFKALLRGTLAVANYLNHVKLPANCTEAQRMRQHCDVAFKFKDFANFEKIKPNNVEGMPRYPNGASPSVEYVIRMLSAEDLLDNVALEELHAQLTTVHKYKIWTLEQNIDSLQEQIAEIAGAADKVPTWPPEEKIQDNFHKVARACATEAAPSLKLLSEKQTQVYDEFYQLAQYCMEDPFDKEEPFRKDEHMLQCTLDSVIDIVQSMMNTMANWRKSEAMLGKAKTTTKNTNTVQQANKTGKGIIGELSGMATQKLAKQDSNLDVKDEEDATSSADVAAPRVKRERGGRLNVGRPKDGVARVTSSGKGKGGKGGKGGDDGDSGGSGGRKTFAQMKAERAAAGGGAVGSKGGKAGKGGKTTGPPARRR